MSTYLDKAKICPICKKEFYVPYTPNWSYKIVNNKGVTVFCSWSCLKKSRDKVQKSRKYKSAYEL